MPGVYPPVNNELSLLRQIQQLQGEVRALVQRVSEFPGRWSRGTGVQLPLLHITGELGGAGKYTARIVEPKGGGLASAANMSASDLGADGPTDVAAWNLDEIGQDDGHWLTGAPKEYFKALMLLGNDEAGRPVYLIDGSWSYECPPVT